MHGFSSEFLSKNPWCKKTSTPKGSFIPQVTTQPSHAHDTTTISHMSDPNLPHSCWKLAFKTQNPCQSPFKKNWCKTNISGDCNLHVLTWWIHICSGKKDPGRVRVSRGFWGSHGSHLKVFGFHWKLFWKEQTCIYIYVQKQSQEKSMNVNHLDCNSMMQPGMIH